MPFVYDFSESLDDIHTVEVSPKGWNKPVTIEYIIAHAHEYDPMVSVVWRVKGTTTCFTIGEQRLNHISNGDYKSHFKSFLEIFAKDYNSWFVDKIYDGCEWRDEYERQFGKLITKNTDNKGKN